jgi:hypothetical protein
VSVPNRDKRDDIDLKFFVEKLLPVIRKHTLLKSSLFACICHFEQLFGVARNNTVR